MLLLFGYDRAERSRGYWNGPVCLSYYPGLAAEGMGVTLI